MLDDFEWTYRHWLSFRPECGWSLRKTKKAALSWCAAVWVEVQTFWTLCSLWLSVLNNKKKNRTWKMKWYSIHHLQNHTNAAEPQTRDQWCHTNTSKTKQTCENFGLHHVMFLFMSSKSMSLSYWHKLVPCLKSFGWWVKNLALIDTGNSIHDESSRHRGIRAKRSICTSQTGAKVCLCLSLI